MSWPSMVLLGCIATGIFLQTVLSSQDASSELPSPVIATKAGHFQGLKRTPPGQTRSVYEFLGIPYAKPPTGPKRFSKPQPADFIPGIFSATRKPPSCFQLDRDLQFPWADTNSSMSENCLYLNIWGPERFPTEEKLKAVMVWIHGGGYTAGSTAMDLYDGGVMAAHGDVVIATLNYRLGPFGFLSTLDDDAPGNVALLDQILALQWVRTNIEYFGGDPKRVTVFGESAGAMCTGYLALSPLARDLFQRIILQSGSSYASPTVSPSAGVEIGNELATQAGCANETFTMSYNSKEIVSCLRNVPATELTKTLYKKNGTSKEEITLGFVPQFWDDVIPKHPIDILSSKNYTVYDIFFGLTQVEGSLFVYFFPEIYQQYVEGKLKINRQLAVTLMNGFLRQNHVMHPQKVIDFYFRDVEDDEQGILNATYSIIGDLIIACPTIYFVEKYSDRGAKVHFYRFDHTPSTSPWHQSMGAAHFEEVQFVFGSPVRYPSRYQDEEKTLSEYMIRTWTDFAKYKDLTLQNGTYWPNFSRSKPQYATFQTGQQIVGSGERKAACEFWRPYFEA